MSLYLDTSCLIKEVLPEPESASVLALVAEETRVVVSTLARLEARLAVESLLVGGRAPRRQVIRSLIEMDRILGHAPHDVVRFPADAVDAAFSQVGGPGSTTYCRALDRLHLGAMQALSVRRLLTNDRAQADAARALGLVVVMP